MPPFADFILLLVSQLQAVGISLSAANQQALQVIPGNAFMAETSQLSAYEYAGAAGAGPAALTSFDLVMECAFRCISLVSFFCGRLCSSWCLSNFC
jgi:hypothetical protein